jgi:PIN domain
MLQMLVDTCVWLDLAKTPAQSRNLEIIESLRNQGAVGLIVPQTVIDEFARNKARVIDEYAKSISTTLSRAREIVVQQGNSRRVRKALSLFNDTDYKIKSPREVAGNVADRIETLLRDSAVMPVSDAIKLRASERAIQKRAPFHRDKNSINDAILVEAYLAFIAAHDKPNERFAFVTHNHKDFSHPASDHRLPHPDLAASFSKRKSRYFIALGEALATLRSKITADWLFEDYVTPTRSISEIGDAIDELITKIWYDRHQVSRQKIEKGLEKLVPKLPAVSWSERKNLIQQDIWEGALKSAAKVETRFGKENLGPWSKFDWGMMNGKVSALRWVLGDEWDTLDT